MDIMNAFGGIDPDKAKTCRSDLLIYAAHHIGKADRLFDEALDMAENGVKAEEIDRLMRRIETRCNLARTMAAVADALRKEGR